MIFDTADIIVIGGGHAGIEASLAAARLGCKTILITQNLDCIGNMPCNPCIGGSAKGQLVREIDALGGEMAKTADKTFIQSRMLGRGKGPAIRSPRVQSDRRKYGEVMKHVLEGTKNLLIKQNEVTKVLTKDGEVCGVETKTGAVYEAKKVIISTGTYLSGRIFLGDVNFESGPDGLPAANELTQSLKDIGVPLRRFKTGTPARVKRDSLDFSKMELQEGDEDISPLSYEHDSIGENSQNCYLTYTNSETHRIIKENLHLSPIYGESADIVGIGPRYCPSIEDKVVRFAEKDRHQIFIEPMGEGTQEMYVQGMSSSLPEHVQIAMMRTMAGLEQVEVMRYAYAIEYECCDPQSLYSTLEFKMCKGLYGAGQFNGTSGYEEAAAQGLVAGINAAMKILDRDELILPRSSSYIGTLIDDLVTKGTNEPYRMMTSRSEYRLLLRSDNADERLTEIGAQVGLISPERLEKFREKQRKINLEVKRLRETSIAPTDRLNALLESKGTSALSQSVKICELIKRPQIDYLMLSDFDSTREALPRDIWEEAQIKIKYEGYIKKQDDEKRRADKLEGRLLPEDIDYVSIKGLRIEAQEKLATVRPKTLGQAARISGVSPADMSVLMIYLR